MLNEITIHGYLGRDPELSEGQSQNGPYKKVTFSVAVSRDFGDETDWFRCILYGKRAEVLEKYFKKGSQIIVTGRMESYKPKNDPERTAWILKADGFDFCDKRSGSNQTAPADGAPDGFEPMQEDDDIPF